MPHQATLLPYRWRTTSLLVPTSQPRDQAEVIYEAPAGVDLYFT